jgi:hypothetical protein
MINAEMMIGNSKQAAGGNFGEPDSVEKKCDNS